MYIAKYPPADDVLTAVPENYAGIVFSPPGEPANESEKAEDLQREVYIPKEFPKENVKVAPVGQNPWEVETPPSEPDNVKLPRRLPSLSQVLASAKAKLPTEEKISGVLKSIGGRLPFTDQRSEDVLLLGIALVLLFSGKGDKLTALVLLALLFIK